MSEGKRQVFVGNIPYGVTEELIVETFSRVGQVLNFRLLYDKETGKPKGFGFLEYADADQAESAVRNMNDYELNGRKLRVDFANESNKDDKQQQSNNAQRSIDLNGQDTAQSVASSALPPLPTGVDLPPSLTAEDSISKTLGTLPAPQLLDIVSQMKALVVSDPNKATELLKQAPQLAYAIFQALLLLKLVDTNVLTTVLQTAMQPVAPQPTAQPTQPVYPQYSAQPQAQYGNVPTPPVAPPYQPPPQTAPAPAPAPALPESDKAVLIQQLLAMPQATIDAMPPTERAQIMALRTQLMNQYTR